MIHGAISCVADISSESESMWGRAIGSRALDGISFSLLFIIDPILPQLMSARLYYLF